MAMKELNLILFIDMVYGISLIFGENKSVNFSPCNFNLLLRKFQHGGWTERRTFEYIEAEVETTQKRQHLMVLIST